MNRARALTVAFAVASAAVAVTAPTGAGPMGGIEAGLAGTDGEIIEDLERVEEELLETTLGLGQDISETSSSIEASEDLLVRGQIELELLADDKLAVLAEREAPAAARDALVLFRYTRGDPRLESFLADLIAGQSEIGPAIERTLYTVLIDDALDEVQGVDDRVRAIDEAREATIDRIQEAIDDLPGLREEYDAALDRLEATTAELLEVQAQIAWEQSAGNRARLTGRPDGSNNERPALAIKIDNVSPARPQVGINQADIVFEEVVEGQLTRLVAVFHSNGSDPVGPIRSVRTSDLLILGNMNSPLFGNSGGNANVMTALRESSLVDVGAIATRSPYFRQSGRPAPSNLFSNTSQLRAAGEGSPAAPPPQLFRFRRPGNPLPETAAPSEGVSIAFGATNVSYRWDDESQGWSRTQDGQAHLDGAGVAVSPTNVIVQFVGYRPSRADARSPEAEVLGRGDVWVFTEGHVIEGRWSRDDLEDVTTYEDGEGDPIELAPGTTWIELAPEDSAALR